MKFKSIRLVWAAKLLKSKFFVVMTERESIIALDGAKPESFSDLLALIAQTAELRMFHKNVGELIEAHDEAIDKFNEVQNAPTHSKRHKTAKKVASKG